MKRNMHINASARIFSNASKLRREETMAEKVLWDHLKNRQIEGEKFRRQHPIKDFVLDFYCYKLRLVIEVDGRQHLKPEAKFYDKNRTEILEAYSLVFLRFSNQMVLHSTQYVVDIIRHKVIELKQIRKSKS